MNTLAANDTGIRGTSMSDIRIVREYPHPPSKVWRVLTDPALMALWMMRPEGFAPVVGTKFKLVAKPQPGWRGYVDCEVLEVREGSLLRYSWVGDEERPPMEVTYRLEATAGGTRLTMEHTGFRGIGGFILAKMMMGPGWKKMLAKRVPEVLAEVGEDGRLRAGSGLKAKY